MQAVYNAVRFDPRGVRHRDALQVVREMAGK
jgi:hypothetical protein